MYNSEHVTTNCQRCSSGLSQRLQRRVKHGLRKSPAVTTRTHAVYHPQEHVSMLQHVPAFTNPHMHINMAKHRRNIHMCLCYIWFKYSDCRFALSLFSQYRGCMQYSSVLLTVLEVGCFFKFRDLKKLTALTFLYWESNVRRHREKN